MNSFLFSVHRQNRRPLNSAKHVATIAFGAFVACSLVGEPSFAEQAPEQRLSVPSEDRALDIEIGGLETQLRAKPDDADLLARVAPVYFKRGDFEKAASAYRKLIEIKGASEETLLNLADALIFGNRGEISPAAKDALTAAVAKNPKSGRGRLWLAIAAEQEGKKEEAQKAYRDMLNDDLNGPLRRMVTERLANLTTSLRQAADAPHGSAPHGSSSAEAPKGHEGNIPEMVEKLADRLKTQGGTIENWVMLIRSYYVLKDEAKAQDAVTRAKQKFAGQPDALALIDGVVRQSTLKELLPEADDTADADAKVPEADAKDAPSAAAAPQESEFGPAIRGMVSRLADRLKDGGGELEEWLQLIRSYSVLKETDKAQEAATKARQKFAANADALKQIDALLLEVKLAAPEAKSKS